MSAPLHQGPPAHPPARELAGGWGSHCPSQGDLCSYDGKDASPESQVLDTLGVPKSTSLSKTLRDGLRACPRAGEQERNALLV